MTKILRWDYWEVNTVLVLYCCFKSTINLGPKAIAMYYLTVRLQVTSLERALLSLLFRVL